MSKDDNYEYTEERIKDFICIDERRHMYISVSDIVGYHLNTGEGKGKYYWIFYLNGRSCLFSEDFDTEEKALDWFDEKFKQFEDK